jgi:hypothetical protein
MTHADVACLLHHRVGNRAPFTRRCDHVARRHQRRHEPRVALLHQRDRLFVEQTTVLDARHAGT